MPLDTSQLDADVENIIADLPTLMTFSGDVYTVSRNSLDRSDLTAVEGLREAYDFSVYLQVSDFGSTPEVDDEVIIDGVTLRVLRTSMQPAKQVLRLDLGEEYAI